MLSLSRVNLSYCSTTVNILRRGYTVVVLQVQYEPTIRAPATLAHSYYHVSLRPLRSFGRTDTWVYNHITIQLFDCIDEVLLGQPGFITSEIC